MKISSLDFVFVIIVACEIFALAYRILELRP